MYSSAEEREDAYSDAYLDRKIADHEKLRTLDAQLGAAPG